MDVKDVAPIVEGKLYAWGIMRLEYPEASISRAYKYEPSRNGKSSQSPQERWAVQHQQELRDASVIESTLKRMSEEQRQLVELRYRERWAWRKVAEKLYVSERTVYTMRDQLLMLFAYEFGLLQTPS